MTGYTGIEGTRWGDVAEVDEYWMTFQMKGNEILMPFAPLDYLWGWSWTMKVDDSSSVAVRGSIIMRPPVFDPNTFQLINGYTATVSHSIGEYLDDGTYEVETQMPDLEYDITEICTLELKDEYEDLVELYAESWWTLDPLNSCIKTQNRQGISAC